MTDRLAGKVAFITGAARGQGQAHALRLASEGADIIAVDICHEVESVPYPMGTKAGLSRTSDEVRGLGRQILTFEADVRGFEGLEEVLDEGVAELGRLDIVSANAGIFSVGRAHELSEPAWNDMIDINLTGVWSTARAAVPYLIDGGGGAMILTSSANGAVAAPMFAHYVAAKFGVVGLTKCLALELAAFGIRVNAVLPGGIGTDMIRNFRDVGTPSVRYVAPDPGKAPAELSYEYLLRPEAVSEAVAFLASDDARHITGTAISVTGTAQAGAAAPRIQGDAHTGTVEG